ncbi:MAG TPA: hypothetical protein VD993_06240 [Chitinophagaceae bacterium]|nr:hypothetical protein [Chitinophagaceae bacterium]
MKKIYFVSLALFSVVMVSAQDFTKRLSEARTSYAAGKLDDSRFAMQQMLQELDILTGKEVLKLLPQKMLDQSVRAGQDNVSGASGFVGVLIHREYGGKAAYDSTAIQLDIISNSPLIGTINALLSLPFGMGSNPDQKIVKVNGYKALLSKTSGSNDKPEFELQLPLNNSLITLKAPGRSQDDILKAANTLPVSDIAKLTQ